MTWRLFLDDIREPSWVYPNDQEGWVIARSYDEAIDAVKARGFPSFISFDHDLGESSLTGYDFAKAIVNMDMDMDMDLGSLRPLDFRYHVHSANPVGAANIRGFMDGYIAFTDSNGG